MDDNRRAASQPSGEDRYANLPDRAPRIGEMVRVRTRRWLVENVTEAENEGSPRVRLACADDDAQGQEIEVFWRYELDRAILNDEPPTATRSCTSSRGCWRRRYKGLLAAKVREASEDRCGRPSRKALVFTTFADTAKYIYENLKELAHG